MTAAELKAVLAALGERDETAEICRDRDGNPEPDADLRDTENVPLKESIEAYFKREVLPHVPDAWIDHDQDQGRLRDPAQPPLLPLRAAAPAGGHRGGHQGLEGDILGAAQGGDGVRLPAYPRYKPSGVEWLGDVPEHWDIRRLKYLAHMRAGSAVATDALEADGEYPVYGGNGMRGYTAAFTHDGSHILIGRQGALCGNVNYAKGRFWSSNTRW